MRISGGEVVALGPEHEGRQEPEQHEMWQDSVVLCWWDLERSIGGYHRSVTSRSRRWVRRFTSLTPCSRPIAC
jgi:hypothetical protein